MDPSVRYVVVFINILIHGFCTRSRAPVTVARFSLSLSGLRDSHGWLVARR